MGFADPNYGKEDFLHLEIDMAKEWMEVLLSEFDKPYMRDLYSELSAFHQKGNPIPPLFEAFKIIDFPHAREIIFDGDTDTRTGTLSVPSLSGTPMEKGWKKFIGQAQKLIEIEGGYEGAG